MILGRGVPRIAGLWCFYFLIAIGLQWAAGAFGNSFGGHSDEGMHYVTGLMVRDYVAQGLPGPPMRFAENYYLHYPEVAFGHWPPVFYVVQAAWTLVFPATRFSLLILMAALTGATAAAVHATAHAALSPVAGFFSGLFLMGLRLTQEHTAMIMAEPLLGLCGFLTLLALVRFLKEDTFRRASVFGLWLGLAILTKPSAWGLAAATPLAFWVTGNGRRLWSARLWTAAGITAILAIPFSILTLGMARAGMEHRQIGWSRIAGALREYALDVTATMGIAGTVVVAAGVTVAFVLPLCKRRLDPLWGVLMAGAIGVLAFHAVVPTLAEPRKIYLLLPAAVLFAAAAVHGAARSAFREAALAAVVLLLAGVQVFSVPRRPASGFAEAVRQLRARLVDAKTVALVSSSHVGGESAFVSEFLETETTRPAHFLLRGSKQLAHATWNLQDYSLPYGTLPAMEAALDDIPVSVVVLDTRDWPLGLPHHVMLGELMRTSPAVWQPVYRARTEGLEYPSPGWIEIYRRTRDLPAKPLRIGVDLNDKLQRSLWYRD